MTQKEHRTGTSSAGVPAQSPVRRALDQGIAVAFAPVILVVQFSALGANTALLGAAAAALDFILLFASILVVAPIRVPWIRLAPVILPMILALGWSLTPALAPAVAPARLAPNAFAAAWAALAGVVAALLAGTILGARPGAMRRTISILLVAGAVWTLVSLALHVAYPGRVWGLDPGQQRDRFSATLLNANAAGCLFAMLAILGAGRYLAAVPEAVVRSLDQRAALRVLAASGAATVLFAAAAALTRSRASAILLVAALLLLLVRFGLRFWRRYGRVALGFAAVPALAPVIAMLLVGGRLVAKMGGIDDDAALRMEAVRHFLPITWEAPWFGYGLGSFREINLRHLDIVAAPDLWNFGAAHMAPIHFALEAGWPFVVLVLAGVIAGIVVVVRAPIRGDPVGASLALAVAVAGACSMIDIALNVPAVAAFTAWLAGLLVGRAARVTEEAAEPRRRAPASGSRA